MSGLPTGEILRELRRVRAHYRPAGGTVKGRLLQEIERRDIRSASLLKAPHADLAFLCAFPDDAAVRAAAERMLARFGARVARTARTRDALENSGIARTRVRHAFAFENAQWLCARFPAAARIEWDAIADDALDALFPCLGTLAEQQTFDDGETSARAWIATASRKSGLSDLAWLMRECRAAVRDRGWLSRAYDAAEVPVVWSLGEGAGSKSRNRLAAGEIEYRTGMRRPGARVAAGIATPLPGIRRLDRRAAAYVHDVVQAAMLARTREVWAMQHANLDEIYLAPVGEGVQIAVLGVQAHARLTLEVNYAYMILANGVPVGYGGFTPLFHQANTGVNIFEEFRGSEAAFLYTQVLRVAHNLCGCTRFVVNPYQFGEDNEEALASGAFWFYYRLGFRPVDGAIRRLAAEEHARVRAGARSSARRLERLAACDMHLLLPGARAEQFFPERWLGVLAQGATALIARQPAADRRAAVRDIAATLETRLDARRASWSPRERIAFAQLAPIFAQLSDLKRWTGAERRALLELIRAKAGPVERDFALRMRDHSRLRRSLSALCRQHERAAVA